VSSKWGGFGQVGLRLDGFSGFSGLVYAIDNLSELDPDGTATNLTEPDAT
jgi:hypothetical protein